MKDINEIKACVFDTFGTVLDWRGSISRQVADFAKSKGVDGDWDEFADQWRGFYYKYTSEIGLGKRQYLSIDYIHRIGLEELAPEFGFPALTEEEKVHLLGAWRKLEPWPDSVEGLSKLKTKFLISPLSNSDFGMMTEMSKHAGLPWDAIIAAELAQTYKPSPTTYLLAPKLYGFEPHQVLMCAAHVLDLKAARNAGLSTAFIARPNEFGGPDNKHYKADLEASPEDDFTSEDIIDLAQTLGA